MRRRFIRIAVAVAVAAIATAGLASAATQPKDVITSNRYSITIDGYEIATFQELSGIVAEVEPSEYWEVNPDGVQVNKLPGKVKPPQITLKRGMTGGLELWAWHEAVRQGNMGAARRSCTLTMFNSDGVPVAKYWLEKAWPQKVELAGLNAGASEALIETVTLTAEHVQRVAP